MRRGAASIPDTARLVTGDVIATVQGLKDEPGDELADLGKRQTAQTLLQHGFVDRFRLMTFPVVLGSVTACSTTASSPATMRPAALTVTDLGIVIGTYEPAPTWFATARCNQVVFQIRPMSGPQAERRLLPDASCRAAPRRRRGPSRTAAARSPVGRLSPRSRTARPSASGRYLSTGLISPAARPDHRLAPDRPGRRPRCRPRSEASPSRPRATPRGARAGAGW